ncbi:TlpA disulfide reductase family protein [Larkinella terrae]|uniref:Redoxin domain-containing protein n=1 Tax=Larkinella terrae TaxID=2025311 RepID=A0A7K0EU45_9BACT|nr:TlpA disulfide reductase family protein [Larkinella terrae]MRS65031.1 redoxin domain-containing protein [Larkinella terrae]
MNRIVLVFALLLAGKVLSQKPVARYSITGYLKNLNNQTVYLIPHSELNSPNLQVRRIDSCVAREGRFAMEGIIGEPNYFAIGIKGQTRTQFKFFILDDTPVSIVGDADSLERASILGSSSFRDELVLHKSIEMYLKSQKNLEPLMMHAVQYGDKDKSFVLHKKYQDLHNGILDIKSTFISFNPKSLVSLFTLLEILPDIPKERAKSLYNRLDYSLQNHSVGKHIREQVFDQMASLRQYAPNLVLTDRQAKPVDLLAKKGSVVLIDFWASWCDHCVREHTQLKSLYKRYKDKGLTIISVSVDEDRKAWKKALQKANLPWTQLSDRVGSKNVVGTQYGNNSIPMNLLIDKEGFIIRKGLHGAELEKQLALVFN